MALAHIPALASKNLSQHGKLFLDMAARRAFLHEDPLQLTPTEFALLAHLAQAAPRTVSFAELAEQVQEAIGEPNQNAQEMLRYHIYRLRRKLDKAAGGIELIQTVPGQGYLFATPVGPNQPSGTVTFLFSDIEGSTKLWEQDSQTMKAALRRHDSLLRSTVEAYNGYIFKTVGDGFYVAFSHSSEALAAALAGQRLLQEESWPTATPLRVRMALATGFSEEWDGDYFGPPLNLAARLLAAAHGGQILLAQATQTECVRDLPPGIELLDLGLRHFKGLPQAQRIFQAVATNLLHQFPPLRTLAPRPNNLPAELNSFVGREDTIRAINARLRRAEVRLVTLTGPGGIGKTRLSLRIAASLREEYEDGVFFVPVAGVREPALIPTAIANALGIQESPDRMPLEEVSAYLRNRQLLLVLDNFEHLIEAAPLVNDLLRGAPHLNVLVTSREALLIYGEESYSVPPLTLPNPREALTLGLLDRFSAPSLLVHRIRASAPSLPLADEDAPLLAQICARLDGLPLAIELVASRAREFSLTDIAAQLTRRLDFLTTGPRDLPARQRTLRGALDWSYALLTPDEKRLFANLALFVGGWDLPAAQQVMEGMGLSAEQIAAGLASLAAKSLLQPQLDNSCRFAFLESIREYAEERLRERGEVEAIRQRHAAYYRGVVAECEAELTGEQQAATYAILRAEAENLRAALAWSLEQPGETTALEMCAVLWRWWAAHSHLREGRAWLAQALERQISAPAAVRAKALWGAGRLAFFQGDYAGARTLLEESLTLYSQEREPEDIAWVLDAIGAICLQEEHYAEAQRLFTESLALHRATDNRRGISHALDDLGQIAFRQGDLPEAARLFEESLSLRRQWGSPEGTAVAIVNLSEALGMLGQYARAEILLQEARQIYTHLGQLSGVALSLGNLGGQKKRQGMWQEAIRNYAESINCLCEVEMEETELVVENLLELAEALYLTGQSYAAGRVVGAAESRLDRVQSEPALRVEYERHRAAARAGLDAAAWARAWGEGQRMALTTLVATLAPQPTLAQL